MSYKVIHYFADLQDSNYPYNVGDTFPRLGMVVSQSRLDELSSDRNKQGKPLIVLEKSAEVKEKKEEVVVGAVSDDVQYTKTIINRMSSAVLKELAIKESIDGAEDMTGTELKKVLIKHFKL